MPGSSFVRGDLEFILSVDNGVRFDYHSVTSPADDLSPDKRLDYIQDSIMKYQSLDLSQYNNAVVCVCYSSACPVSDAILSGFFSRIREFFSYENFRSGTIKEDGVGREVKVILLLNKY